MRMLVLGAGLQGSACAFDLLQNPDVSEVRLADLNVARIPGFLAPYTDAAALAGAKPRLVPTPLDAKDTDAVRALMRQSDAAMSALPYYFNGPMARLAVECGAHFCDLGGNTEIVFEQKKLDAEAKAANVSVIPDCGLAPGMVNILAQHGIDQLDEVSAVRMFVGGLPQHPEPPLNYQIVYSLEGALDYYTTSRSSSRRRSGRSRRSTPPGGCRRCRSGTRGRSPRWSTRRSATRGTRTSWRRSASWGSSTCSRSR